MRVPPSLAEYVEVQWGNAGVFGADHVQRVPRPPTVRGTIGCSSSDGLAIGLFPLSTHLTKLILSLARGLSPLMFAGYHPYFRCLPPLVVACNHYKALITKLITNNKARISLRYSTEYTDLS